MRAETGSPLKARSRSRELFDGLRLASIPFGVALAFAMLLLPRRAAPDGGDVPVPMADAHALAHATEVDHERAEHARHELLPGTIRAVGSAMRAYHALEASPVTPELAGALVRAQRAIGEAVGDARPAGDEPMLELRALELEGFIAETHRFEATGVESGELVALAGSFIRAMTTAGWCTADHRLLPTEAALRTLYKQMWNGLAGADARPGFEPSLDEERAVYGLYFGSPHPSQGMRDAIEAARRGAHDPGACEAVREAERSATEAWRLDRIGKFAAIDPTYPAAYASGVSSFRRADYRGASQAFRAWLGLHPDGPYTLRAQAFLRAADSQSE